MALLPKTGSAIDMTVLIEAGLMLVIADSAILALSVIKKKRA